MLATDKFQWLELITIILSPLVIQFEKKQSLSFLIFEKICERIIKSYISDIFWTFKSKFQIIYVSAYMTVFLPDSNNCFFYMQYHVSLSVSSLFSFFCFHSTFLFLTSSPQDTFCNLLTIFNSISLQPTFDFSISLQDALQKIFTKLNTTLQNEERNDEKELL